MQLFKKRHQSHRLEDYRYLVSKEKPLSYITESFQKVALNIETANIDHQSKIIQVTSTQPDEGKSTLITNVGYLLAQQQKKTLLIDLDLRRPKLHKIFHTPNKFGLIDYIIGKCDLEQIINHCEDSDVHYIVAGTRTQLITHVLSSQKLKDLLDELNQSFDYILLDSPPVLSVSDALYISKLSDAVIYVIAEDRAKKSAIKEGVELLMQQNAKILGAVLTQKTSHFHTYKYKYDKSYYTKND